MRLIPILLVAGLLSPVRCAPALSVVQAVVSQSEDGPALPASATVVGGETVFLSFLVEGYSASPENKVRLAYSVDATDPGGIRIQAPLAGAVEEELTPQDKDWRPKIRQPVVVPPLAPPGVYKIAIEVRDALKGAVARRELNFNVRGREIAPSGALVVRNFRFYRAEEDREPLTVAAYRPGETLWARFDITGYKFGQGNEFHVEYGVRVLAPGGRVLFTQDPAAVEQNQSFYPQRYVPGIMNLSLQPTIRPGEYGIVITARDRKGEQSVEERVTFSIE